MGRWAGVTKGWREQAGAAAAGARRPSPPPEPAGALTTDRVHEVSDRHDAAAGVVGQRLGGHQGAAVAQVGALLGDERVLAERHAQGLRLGGGRAGHQAGRHQRDHEEGAHRAAGAALGGAVGGGGGKWVAALAAAGAAFGGSSGRRWRQQWRQAAAVGGAATTLPAPHTCHRGRESGVGSVPELAFAPRLCGSAAQVLQVTGVQTAVAEAGWIACPPLPPPLRVLCCCPPGPWRICRRSSLTHSSSRPHHACKAPAAQLCWPRPSHRPARPLAWRPPAACPVSGRAQ